MHYATKTKWGIQRTLVSVRSWDQLTDQTGHIVVLSLSREMRGPLTLHIHPNLLLSNRPAICHIFRVSGSTVKGCKLRLLEGFIFRTSSMKFSRHASHQGLTKVFVVRGKPCPLKMDDVRLLRYCYMLIHTTSYPDGGHRHQYQCEITNSRISPPAARCINAADIPNTRKRSLSLTTPSAVSLHSSLSTVNRLRDGDRGTGI